MALVFLRMAILTGVILICISEMGSFDFKKEALLLYTIVLNPVIHLLQAKKPSIYSEIMFEKLRKNKVINNPEKLKYVINHLCLSLKYSSPTCPKEGGWKILHNQWSLFLGSFKIYEYESWWHWFFITSATYAFLFFDGGMFSRYSCT